MRFLKIDDELYEAAFKLIPSDPKWDGRVAYEITPLDSEVVFLFRDDKPWFIVERHEEPDPEHEGEHIVIETVTDCSDFNVVGDIVKHNTGTASLRMGRTTDLEEAYELLYGGMYE